MTEFEKQIKNHHQERMNYNTDFNSLRKKLNLNKPFKSKNVFTIKIVTFILGLVIVGGIFLNSLKSACDNMDNGLLEKDTPTQNGETLYDRFNSFIKKIAGNKYEGKELTEENSAYGLLKNIADSYVEYTVYSDLIKENVVTEFYLGTRDDDYIVCSKILVRENDCNIIITCNNESKIIDAELTNRKMFSVNKYFLIQKSEEINISIEYVDSTGYKEEIHFIINTSEVLEDAVKIKK